MLEQTEQGRSPAPHLPKLHPYGRRAIDNLRHDLLRLGTQDLTTRSAVEACDFLLKYF